MKKIKLFLMALFAMTAACQIAVAQENGNRDENNKIVRGPYLTNDAGDNWWINIGTGITAFGDGGMKADVTPLLDFNFGKWFTPSIGFRLGYQGVTGGMWKKDEGVFGADPSPRKDDWYKQRFGYSYVHTDFMWNISNAFSGYKETRFWNVIPYLHAGTLFLYQRDGKGVIRGFANGAGIYNTMRVCDRAHITLDVRGTLLSGRQLKHDEGIAANIAVALGVSVNLGKTNFTRKTVEYRVDESALARLSELELANEKLAAEKENLAGENARLTALNAELAAKEIIPEITGEGIYSNTFYFIIGKSKLTTTELSHLDFYINKIRENIQKGQTIMLTARCDKETGSQKRNEYLAKARIETMKKILIEKYGLEDANFEGYENIVSSKIPELDRAVVISFK